MNVGLKGWDECRFGRIGCMQVWKDWMDVGLKGWDGLRQTETINKTKCPQLKELKTKKTDE